MNVLIKRIIKKLNFLNDPGLAVENEILIKVDNMWISCYCKQEQPKSSIHTHSILSAAQQCKFPPSGTQWGLWTSEFAIIMRGFGVVGWPCRGLAVTRTTQLSWSLISAYPPTPRAPDSTWWISTKCDHQIAHTVYSWRNGRQLN